jgi:NADH-quinone oxidoreductase subunit L
MFRLYYNIFWGKNTHYHHTPHEAPKVMTIPLMILAFGAIFAGFLPFNEWVTSDGMGLEKHTVWAIAIPSVLIGVAGILLATLLYKNESAIPDRLAGTFKYLYKWAYHKFYIDEVYLFVTKKIIFQYISAPIAWFDRHIVDGTMNGIAGGYPVCLLSYQGITIGKTSPVWFRVCKRSGDFSDHICSFYVKN